MDDQRKRIIEVSVKLFLKKGYAGTTVNEIAESAGLSKGGLYWYFKSKEEIADAIIDKYNDEFGEVIQNKIKELSGDFVTKFKGFYKFSTEFSRENKELLLVFTTLLIEFAGTNTDLEKRMKKISNDYTLIIQDMLVEGIKNGTVTRGIDPVIYSRIFASALIGSQIQWYLGDWAFDKDPLYNRRHAIIQRDALLEIVLHNNSSKTRKVSKSAVNTVKPRKSKNIPTR